jgi:geranylgeranyl pyrophosphate synthase
MTSIEVQADEQQAVIEAVEVAASRGLPLAADLAGRQSTEEDAAGNTVNNGAEPQTTAKTPALKSTSGETVLPRPAPWSQLSPETVEKVQSAGVMSSLLSIAPRMAAVEAEIERLITSPIKLIADVASHTLAAGGKRLRPALTLLCAQLCGDGNEAPNARVVTAAAAVELTHTTSLLHDDVVDEADTRRGRPTARLLWGNETSVLVGDYLFAQVFVTAAQKGFGEMMQPLAVATAQMCAGELLETQTRGYLQMNESQYREIIALKTASLVDCACRLGAMAMQAPEEHVEKLARFGHDVGMAFQIVDDVFDITATEGRIGKPVGNDIREGDITLPMLRAMQVCSEAEQAELCRILGATAQGGEISEADVQSALDIMRGCDAVEYSLTLAREYVDAAKKQLQDFPDSTARHTLIEIADYVLSREK